MADASIPNLADIRQENPRWGRALDYVQQVINNIGRQGNMSPVGATPPPPKHANNSVMGGAGKLDIKIDDPHPAYMGAERFADVSADGSFASFHTIHIGATTNWRGDSPVSGMAYVRTYSQYPTSPQVSPFLYHRIPVDTAHPTAAGYHSGDTTSGYGGQYSNSTLPPKR